MNGWISIHRNMKSWEWYKSPKHFKLFMHLLIDVNHADGKWKGVEIKRGQTLTGRKALASETGLSEQNVRTVLKDLESTSEVTIKKYNKYSMITVVNYDKYQLNTGDQPAKQPPSNQRSNHEVTSESTSDLTTNNKYNKLNKNNNNNKSVFDFDFAYSLYPKKAGKASGMKKAISKIKSQKKYDLFIQAIKNYSSSVELTDPQYILHFSTFVGKYEDFVVMEAQPLSNKPSRANIMAALSSGARKLDEVHGLIGLKLSEAECELIRNSGGLTGMNMMGDFGVNQILNKL